MTTPWQEWKKKNAERQATGVVRPWDFANPDTEYVTKEKEEERYALCEACPYLLSTKQCSKCGCVMPAKVKLLHAVCPIDKW